MKKKNNYILNFLATFLLTVITQSIYAQSNQALDISITKFKVSAPGKGDDLGTDLQTMIGNVIGADKKFAVAPGTPNQLGGKLTQFETQGVGKVISRWDGARGTGNPTLSMIFKLVVTDASSGVTLLSHKFNIDATKADTTGEQALWANIDTHKYNKIEAAALYKAATEIIAFLVTNEADLKKK